jgi:mycothiol synthase
MTISQANPPLGMGSDPPPPDGHIIQVGADQQEEAVQWLLASGGRPGRAAARRFLDYAAQARVRLDAMWSIVDRHGSIHATVLAVPSAGKTAMVFATTPLDHADTARIGRLIAHAATALAGMDVHLAQCLLEPGQHLQQAAFERGGFTPLAELSYLERPLKHGSGVAAPAWPEGVTVEPAPPSVDSAILEVLAASYEQTLDCPELTGLRDVRDILDGHRATGRHEPALWTLMRIDGRPSGVLLLNPSPLTKSIELVYLGLALNARGKGLGRHLLRHGLHLLADRDEATITLAVDDRNAPALALYLSEGFRRSLRRVAMIRPLRAGRG